jgi:hypothetical protein
MADQTPAGWLLGEYERKIEDDLHPSGMYVREIIELIEDDLVDYAERQMHWRAEDATAPEPVSV